MELKSKYFTPLVGFLILTPIITLILWSLEEFPPIGIQIGFIVLLVAASLTYYMGIKTVADNKKRGGEVDRQAGE